MSTHAPMDVEAATRAYVEAALWASSCNGTAEHEGCRGEDCDVSLATLGYTAETLDPGTADIMAAEVRAFVALCAEERPNVFDGINPALVGVDFWLTRNGHGAGFWDRGLGEVGDHLTYWAKTYGHASLYVTDGTVYDA